MGKVHISTYWHKKFIRAKIARMEVKMNYKKENIKEGITLHEIKTSKFKTNLFAVFLAMPLEKETVTKNALISAVLRRGTSELNSQDQISKKLEEMYGASFDCGIEKTGDNQVLKFYLEAVNEQFLPEKEELNKKCIDLLFSIIFDPLIENGAFKEEYVESEKNNLKQIIEGKKDNKRAYALERCIEEMFKNSPYGLYKFGSVEDLENINAQNLYEQYQKLISECKIDIFISGENKNEEIIENIKGNQLIQKLNARKAKYIPSTTKVQQVQEKQENLVEEHMDVGQGNLVIGVRLNSNAENAKYIGSVYNAILGGGANSKLFQNVREKESLAYTASSNFKRQKDTIFIRAGIEISKFEKALSTIKKQLEDIKNGNFSDEDIQNSKELIVASIKAISSEQDTEITYYYGQELSDKFVSLDEYIENINKVSKDEIQEVAQSCFVDTVYFLRD